MPVSRGRWASNSLSASSPPADAPIPAIVNGSREVARSPMVVDKPARRFSARQDRSPGGLWADEPCRPTILQPGPAGHGANRPFCAPFRHVYGLDLPADGWRRRPHATSWRWSGPFQSRGLRQRASPGVLSVSTCLCLGLPFDACKDRYSACRGSGKVYSGPVKYVGSGKVLSGSSKSHVGPVK